MPRRYSYTQTLILDCGHLGTESLCVAELGGMNPRYVCDDCTEERYGVRFPADGLCVWRRAKPEPKAVKPKAPAKSKSKRAPQPWDVFLTGLDK